MNKYVVAISGLYPEGIKQFKVTAESEYAALNMGMILFAEGDKEVVKQEKKYQKTKDYPQNYNELVSQLELNDFLVSVIMI